MKTKYILIAGLTVLFFSCHKNKIKIPENIVAKKDSISKELVAYYKKTADTFKLGISGFLLENSQYHFHQEGVVIDKYEETIKTMKFESGVQNYHLKKLEKELKGKFDKRVSDIFQLSGTVLTAHVDTIIDYYNKVKWKNKIDQKDIYNYLTPYNIDVEGISPWATFYRKEYFEDNNDSILQMDIDQAVSKIHRWIFHKTLGYLLVWGNNNLVIPEISPVILDNLRVGTCHQLSVRSVAIMRSLGVPATIDFIPNYLNMASGHSWSVAITGKDKFMPFDATTWEIGVYKKNSYKICKIYRKAFAINNNSHILKKGYCAYLPKYFNNMFNVDVTNLYTSVSSIEIPVKNKSSIKPKLAYLSVFTDREWKAIDWGNVKNNSAKFNNIGRDGVYLPSFIEAEGTKQINGPFLLDTLGQVHYLIPDIKHVQNMKLIRKYPLSRRKRDFLKRMVGGCFQVANKVDFSDAVTVAKIEENPGEYSNEITVNQEEEYRYIRYCAPPKSHGNVAEIEFYGETKDDKLEGRIMGTNGSWENNKLTTKAAAFDGNPLTFVDTEIGDNVWFGLDLGKKKKINYIRFLARNDMNATQKGNEYELLYWDEEWVSMGRKKTTTVDLIYENVPSKALYWLRNHTSGKEERIFTYENGKQVWW